MFGELTRRRPLYIGDYVIALPESGNIDTSKESVIVLLFRSLKGGVSSWTNNWCSRDKVNNSFP